LISLKFLQEFSDAVFIGVAMESLLENVKVLLAMLEQQLKSATTFDPIVASRSNFYMSFRRSFPLG
jgi:hypothetical protein